MCKVLKMVKDISFVCYKKVSLHCKNSERWEQSYKKQRFFMKMAEPSPMFICKNTKVCFRHSLLHCVSSQ